MVLWYYEKWEFIKIEKSKSIKLKKLNYEKNFKNGFPM